MHLFSTVQRAVNQDTATRPDNTRSAPGPSMRSATAPSQRLSPSPAADTPAVLRNDRTQIVAEILERNHGVTAQWLDQFDNRGLSDYLRRLRELAAPDSSGLRPWVRQSGEPAVIGRVVRA